MTDFFKCAKASGWDTMTGNSVNYRDGIGKTVSSPHPTPEHIALCRAGILHAFDTLEKALDRSHITVAAWGRSIYRVQGTPCCDDGEGLYGFLSLYIVEELTEYYTPP